MCVRAQSLHVYLCGVAFHRQVGLGIHSYHLVVVSAPCPVLKHWNGLQQFQCLNSFALLVLIHDCVIIGFAQHQKLDRLSNGSVYVWVCLHARVQLQGLCDTRLKLCPKKASCPWLTVQGEVCFSLQHNTTKGCIDST